MARRYLLELTQQTHDGLPDSVVTPFLSWGELELDPDRLRKDPKSVRALFLSGGTDVAASRYGEHTGKWTQSPDLARDSHEIEMVHLARAADIPIVGICRGAQLLNVLAGGKLVQHLEGHGLARHETHNMRALDVDGRFIDLECSSTHHQSVLPPPGAEVMAWAEPRLAGGHYYNGNDELIEVEKEIEGVFYPSLRAIGIQWHPEWMAASHPCVQYSVRMAAARLRLEL